MSSTPLTVPPPAPEIPAELAYLILRTALARFKKATAELNAAELKTALAAARQQFKVESQILSSPEAAEVEVAEADFMNHLAEIQGRYEDQANFMADLARNGMDLSQLQTAIRRELHVEVVLTRVGARAADISDVDVKIYYYMHPERFTQPELRTARHILLTINPEFPENTREQAHQRLEQIRKRLLKKPQRFAEQAMKHSECPTALQGGLLGRLPQGQLFPSLDTALFALSEGQMSGIIESELGFHVLLCEAIEPAGTMSLKDAYPKILEHLQQRRRRICQKSWLTQIQNLPHSAHPI
ncbi:nitrogen fixation protein NifM [Thioflexithrix psekupsensis]|uniref:peptidylprolyl isomerase n=1 Tax=Thioflexithrix psekupsensis TaxID=1570016 RepID=A0A251X3Z0_9GAMM|nr:nitrogen fixation protein NifM [Thioflexithrix psekupsensis]OUD11654.1 nitrogen fixation protein NifM [Thioflexithrix psekupsensis]